MPHVPVVVSVGINKWRCFRIILRTLVFEENLFACPKRHFISVCYLPSFVILLYRELNFRHTLLSGHHQE